MIISRPVFELWKWAEAAYHQDLVNKLNNANPMIHGDEFGFSLVTNSCVIVSFQGTGTLIKGDAAGKVRDWISNFNAFPSTSVLEASGMTIHAGFYDGWSPFKVDIDALLSSVGDGRPWFITGHSRGGALAALCARHIAKNRGKQCSCVTYGAPAQGGKKYRNEYNLLPVDLTNVVHGYDIVPSMPPQIIGYRHAGKGYWLREPLFHKLFCKISDHLPSNYSKWFSRAGVQ
jgi:triacylglycerol lipase